MTEDTTTRDKIKIRLNGVNNELKVLIEHFNHSIGLLECERKSIKFCLKQIKPKNMENCEYCEKCQMDIIYDYKGNCFVCGDNIK